VIYAIRAVGTQYVKIGKAASVGRRLKELETGCPHELHIEAAADWPDAQESAIHEYLKAHCEKLEWFRDSDLTAKVVKWLQDGEAGLRAFRVVFLEHARKGGWMRLPGAVAAEYAYPSKEVKRRVRRVNPNVQPEIPPSIPMLVSEQDRAKANERFEHIKRRSLARKASKRSQEAAQEPAG
jgi:hypothetical protein